MNKLDRNTVSKVLGTLSNKVNSNSYYTGEDIRDLIYDTEIELVGSKCEYCIHASCGVCHNTNSPYCGYNTEDAYACAYGDE